MVPKHRRSEIESLLPSAGVNTADFLPEAVGYGQATATAWPSGSHSSVGSSGNGYPTPNGYAGAVAEADWAAPDEQAWEEWQDWQDWGPPPAMHPDHPSAPVPRIQFPSDHPSGPMPAVRAPGPPELPQRRPGGSARNWNPPSQRPDAGYGNGGRRLYAVPDHASAVDYGATRVPPADLYRQAGPGPRGVNGYQRQAGPGWQETGHRRENVDYRRQASPGRQETTDYRRETGPFRPGPGSTTGPFGPGPGPTTGPFGPGPGPTTGRFKDFRASNRDSLRTGGQVLEIHHGQDHEFDRAMRPDGRAAQITQEAQDYAASLREAAEREAAAITQEATTRADVITQQATGQADAIRELAQREAAEMRARLDSMSGELSRVAAYLTENLALAPSAMPATAPTLPRTTPDLPDASPVQPDTRPARPDARPSGPGRQQTGPARPQTGPARPQTGPARPETWPGTRPARPMAPDTRPGRPDGPPKPRTTPAREPQKRTRQQQAMRVATAATAALLSVAVISGITEIGLRGLPFFVFRETGTGETGPQSQTDQQFLASEAAPAHKTTATHPSGAKGRHHRKSHPAVVVHSN